MNGDEAGGFTEPDDGPVIDLGYMSLPAGVQEALETGQAQRRAAGGVTRWRKLPVEVGMIRWDGSDEMTDLIGRYSRGAGIGRQAGMLRVWVEKSQAFMWLATGDWAIIEPDGSGVYPCTAEQQAATYEPASSAASQVTVTLEQLTAAVQDPAVAAVLAGFEHGGGVPSDLAGAILGVLRGES